MVMGMDNNANKKMQQHEVFVEEMKPYATSVNVRNVYTQQCKFVRWDRVIVPEKTKYYVFEECTTMQSLQRNVSEVQQHNSKCRHSSVV